jgi:DNA-3-methyladenine glycosylase I
MKRCAWAGDDELYVKYHDEEWGVPVRDDRKLFEFLILEGAQAGLSWITILRKREAYREAFSDWDYNEIVLYGDSDVERLMGNAGIVRNRLKILSAVRNAKVFIEIRKEFGSFSDYLWGFVDGEPVKNNFESLDDIPASTELSEKISKDLKRRGMNFVGATIIYAFMQAVGVVDDHEVGCFRKV